jgi:ABC-type sugar transport system permease subunit
MEEHDQVDGMQLNSPNNDATLRVQDTPMSPIEHLFENLLEEGFKLIETIDAFKSNQIGRTVFFQVCVSLIQIVFKLFFALTIAQYFKTKNLMLLLFVTVNLSLGIIHLVKLVHLVYKGQDFSDAMAKAKKILQRRIAFKGCFKY